MSGEDTAGRNRSEGWKHAKITGHTNEKDFGKILDGNLDLQSTLHQVKYGAGKKLDKTGVVDVDGSKHITSLLGDSVISKVDASVRWISGETLNISIKKSKDGQVWLIPVARFAETMKHYSAPLSSSALAGLSLFIGGENLHSYNKEFKAGLDHSKTFTPRIHSQESRQNRLVAETIKALYPKYWNELIEYFQENVALITELMFSRGVAADPRDFADIVIYNNVVGELNTFLISSIVEAASTDKEKKVISQGPKNGGSTVIFPTGFLQMHKPKGKHQMQFHHKYDVVADLISDD